MTSLRKDGLPVVPICIECEHWYDSVFDACNSPNRARDFDPVHGYTYKTIRCRDARADNNLCGTAGAWYEPRKVVKPTLRQRIRRWLFS